MWPWKYGKFEYFSFFIRKFPQNIYLLEACSLFYSAVNQYSEWEHLLTVDCFKAIWSHLIDNLTSPIHLVWAFILFINVYMYITMFIIMRRLHLNNKDENLSPQGSFTHSVTVQFSILLYDAFWPRKQFWCRWMVQICSCCIKSIFNFVLTSVWFNLRRFKFYF